ncbi:MAG: SMC family ATPase, partial [Candidatus Bathyarchaeia archaeon]
KARKNSEILSEYNFWLSDYFEKTIELIEKQVMMTINQDFNREFEKWFNLLVEDPTKEASIDEDFTPIIRQDGYDQNVEFLSGGEKTSVALAYRLALNSIVKQVSVGMKSNLLILDEPTDGFSKEQLYKVREILDELKCPQIVLVSHENELESFANHIIRIEKTAGLSKINPSS